MPFVDARTLEESRASVVEMLTQGIADEFTYEEVENYLTTEEAKVLETGYFGHYRTYGIDGAHSTSQSMIVADYLRAYFENNMSIDDLEKVYPFAVDFKKLPERLNFYHVDDSEHTFADFDVTNEDGHVSMFYSYWGPNQSRLNALPLEGVAVVNQTQELVVEASNSQEERTVGINTYIDAQGPNYANSIYKIYFFYNQEGTLSLLKWDSINNPQKFAEYSTLESREELEAMAGGTQAVATANNWYLPEDWRMLSPRRGDIPSVTWLMTSTGDGEHFVIEPVNQKEGVVSGYMNPAYSIEVTTFDSMTQETSSIMSARPDESGYFWLDANASIGATPTVRILDEQANLVYEATLPVYQYLPTALAHDSGFLTLERFFIGQTYVEGYTYPHAVVTIMPLNGYGTVGLVPVTADETGYFYSDAPAHQTNLTTNVVSVTHPDTGEQISVAPYPWTQAELDSAQW